MNKENFDLNLNINELNTILRGLAELPYKSVIALVNKIQQSVNTQNEEKPKEEEK